MATRTDVSLWYERVENTFFRTLSEQQWEIMDGWTGHNVSDQATLEQLAVSLSPEQESLALVWAMRLVELLEETIRAKVRTADTKDDPPATDEATETP